MTLCRTCPTSDSTSSGNIRVGYVISQLDRYPTNYPLMNTHIYSYTTTKHSYIEELNNKASTTKKSRISLLPRETPIYINTSNTTLYVRETRLLSSRTNTQLPDSHLSPLEATTSQAVVSNDDIMPLLGYPGPLFKTRPAHDYTIPKTIILSDPSHA